MRSRALVRAQHGAPIKWGSMGQPVRVNLPYGGEHGQLLTNLPDSWELEQAGPLSWLTSGVADGGSPPAWWIGESREDGCSPIGPHGPSPRQRLGWGLPIVTRATSLIVDPLTTGLFRVLKDGRPVPAPLWMADPQLLRPAPGSGSSSLPVALRHTRSIFWRGLLSQAVWWGRSFLLFECDAAGDPLAGTLRVVPRFNVTETEEGLFALADDVVSDFDGRFEIGGRTYRLARLDNPHSPRGVFWDMPDAFELGRKIASYAGGIFGSGVPNGYLKVTAAGLTKDQADQLKARWLAAHGGDRRSIAVLNSTTDFTPIQYSPVDSALAEVKRLSIADIAYAFGMAPETLGVTMGNSATYSNVEQWFEAHRDFALSPWIASLEGFLSALVPWRSEAKVNLDVFESPPFSERMAAYATALSAGILTVDEVRALDGLDPLPQQGPEPGDPAKVAQQAYLAVGKVLTVEEARDMVRATGFPLPPRSAEAVFSELPPLPQAPETEATPNAE